MQSIKNILQTKGINKSKGARKINLNYEKAAVFAKRYKLNTLFVLKLFKKYSPDKVLGLDSWLRDAPVDERGYLKLLVWKLKQDFSLS